MDIKTNVEHNLYLIPPNPMERVFFIKSGYKIDRAYKCPDLKDMKHIFVITGKVFYPDISVANLTLEHHGIVFLGKQCHMFVDEEGMRRGYPPNPKATRLFYNRLATEAGATRWVYNNLDLDPEWAEFKVLAKSLIVGPALFWQGPMGSVIH